MAILRPIKQRGETPTLQEVNKWAKKSCPRWNKNQLSRRAYRKAYRDAAIEFANSSTGERISGLYLSGVKEINTYPWPYSDPDFANWEEDDSEKGYSLISDQSGCVVKYATSYCAWKIYELTGVWPQKTSSERLDAKRWVQFLAEAGYTETVSRPENRHYYVGVKPDEGKWGLVVWFESDDAQLAAKFGGKPFEDDSHIFVSSYVDKAYKAWWAAADDFTWVKIR